MDLVKPQLAPTTHDATMHMAVDEGLSYGKEHAEDEFPLEVSSESFSAGPAGSRVPHVSLGVTPACLPRLQGTPVADMPSGTPLGAMCRVKYLKPP